MQFKELQRGHKVFFLEKEPELKVCTAKVINVTPPHFETAHGFSSPANMVVDITIDRDGKVTTYTMSESSSVAYPNEMTMISTDKAGIIREVETIKEQSAQIIASVERNEKLKSSAEKILDELNPEFHEKKETEMRFKGIESKINSLGQKLDDILKVLK